MTVIKPIANDGWKSWFDSYDAPSVGRGSSGTVLAIDEDLVIKTYVEDEEGQRDFDREKEIFEILQSDSCSPYIVRFFEEWESGLVLERLRGTLRSHLREKLPPAEHDKTQWILDTCKGLEFLHEKGIMHGDVGCHNFLVDYRGRVKLCDFAGSSRDGETARICYEVRGQHPDYQIGEPTVATEIFGLGSTFFEICTLHAPYHHQTDQFVRKMFRSRRFPVSDIKCPRMKRIIERCWTGYYTSVSEVYQALLQAGVITLRLKVDSCNKGF